MKIDLLIKDVKVFNSYLKKFNDANVAILNGKILYIDKEKNENFEPVKTVELNGRYMIPGFIDIHMHIESSMATPEPFSHLLAKNGVTTIVSEPHEMANVFGLKGVESMIDAAKNCEIDIFYGIPSSVPSTSEKLETTGGVIGFDDMLKLSSRKEVLCVGEVMNYTKIIKDNTLEICRFINYIKKEKPGYVVEGHCPKLVGLDLAKFLYAGIDGDHTEHTLEEVIQRFENGMFVEIQVKMLHDEIIEYIMNNNLYEHFSFVTDDVMADDFVKQGHLNNIVKKAIEKGMRIEDAVYCATFTPARRMNLRDRGSLSPGKLADFIIIDDINNMEIESTYKDGKIVYDKFSYEREFKSEFQFPDEFYRSVNVKNISRDSIQPKCNIKNGVVKCRVMEISDGRTATKEVFREIEVKDNRLILDNSDVLFATVFERYNKNGTIGYGLVTGDCIKKGAVATTYAHDNHNLLVVGKTVDDMITAANEVVAIQGGIAVVQNEKVLSKIKLNIAGILSDKDMTEIGRDLGEVKDRLKELGYKHYNPIMSLCTLSLPVSPELKLTNKGLVDVKKGEVVDIFI